MKISTLSLGFLPLVMSKSIIVSYPKDTPQSVVDHGKQSIIDGGGHITHEYSLLKGFSADAPEEAVSGLAGQSPKHPPSIEDDQTVSAVHIQ